MAVTTTSSGPAGQAGLSGLKATEKEGARKCLELHDQAGRPLSLPRSRAPGAFVGVCFPNSSADRSLLAAGPSQSQAIE